MRHNRLASQSAITDAFHKHCKLRNLRPASIKNRQLALRRLSRFVGGGSLLDLDDGDLAEWWDDCLRLTPEGRATELSHVRSFYRWAVEDGLIATDPTRRLVRPRLARRLPRPIADDRLQAVLETAPDRIRLILVLAAFAGLRAGEIARLRVEDVAVHETPPVIVIRHGKGDKDRVVPAAPIVLDELASFVGARARGFVFARLDGRPGQCPEHRISQVACGYLRAQGIPETLHQLRHRFGTAMYRASQDLRLVQEVLGHASPLTTAGYAAFAPARAAAAVDAAAALQTGPP